MTTATPSVVIDALNIIAEKNGFKKPGFHVEIGAKAGDGISSVVYRAVIREEEGHNGSVANHRSSALSRLCCTSGQDSRRTQDSNDNRSEDKVLSLMCKTAVARAFNDPNAMLFKGEGFMYSTVLPAMADISHLAEPLPWPRCDYMSVEDPTQACLVLSDLGAEGFTMLQRGKPMDAEQCRLALQQLARFHGAGMALEHLKPDLFDHIRKNLPDQMANPEMQQRMSFVAQMATMTPGLLKDRFPEGSEGSTKLAAFFATLEQAMMGFLTPPSSVTPGYALAHGDCHARNMMFKRDSSTGATTECRLIDFQLCRYGCTAVDLTGLLLISTEKSLRDAHWDDLMRGYLGELQSCLRAAGCANPDAVYSWEQLQECLGLGAKVTLFLAPLMLHVSFLDDSKAEDLREQIGGLVEANGDMNIEKATSALQFQPTPHLIQNLGDIVQDMIDRNWL